MMTGSERAFRFGERARRIVREAIVHLRERLFFVGGELRTDAPLEELVDPAKERLVHERLVLRRPRLDERSIRRLRRDVPLFAERIGEALHDALEDASDVARQREAIDHPCTDARVSLSASAWTMFASASARSSRRASTSARPFAPSIPTARTARSTYWR